MEAGMRTERTPEPAKWCSAGSACFQASVQAEFYDILNYHPHKVVNPHPSDNLPGQRRHQPALGAHEYGSNLSCHDSEEQLRIWMWRHPERLLDTHHK